MVTTFKCNANIDEQNESWIGTIKKIINHGSHYELIIESRSSINVIVGSTHQGNFACIPNWGAGCHLSSFKDTFWNEEQLIKVLGIIDGVTVAKALSTIADYM